MTYEQTDQESLLSVVFKMLGLVVNLRNATSKAFFVSHTEERRSTFQQSLEDLIQKGDITQKEAERIRGRNDFFEFFELGRIANLDLELFGDLCRAGRSTSTLSVD